MKHSKLIALSPSALLVFSGCNMNNTTKGGLIGGGSGAALGTLIGGLIGKSAGGAAIGAGIGAAVGAGAGILIGKKMDKAKAAAEAVENAQVESVTDANGLQAVKVTFDSGILFASGKSDLSATAKSSLSQFAKNVLIPNSDMDVAIQGYTDNSGFKGCTTEQSYQKNLELSQNRASAVSAYLLNLGVPGKQIASTQGFGEENPVADNSTAAGKQQNRRVEVYLYASAEMIQQANAGTLQ